MSGYMLKVFQEGSVADRFNALNSNPQIWCRSPVLASRAGLYISFLPVTARKGQCPNPLDLSFAVLYISFVILCRFAPFPPLKGKVYSLYFPSQENGTLPE